MRRRLGGLTLAEVVVAIGILAVAGLAVISVFSRLIAAQSKSGHQVVARMLAEQVLEEACLAGPPNWSMTDLAVPQTKNFQLQGAPAPIPFTYKLFPTLVRDPPPNNPMGQLWALTVDVWWWRDGPNQSYGDMGRTSLSSRRMVYIEN